jgi:hypothetical protein
MVKDLFWQIFKKSTGSYEQKCCSVFHEGHVDAAGEGGVNII